MMRAKARHPANSVVGNTAGGEGFGFGVACLEAIPKRLRNGGDGLSGRTRCDSERVFEAVPEPSCGTRPPVRTISERAYAMEAT